MPPAIDGTAMMLMIELTLETLLDVVDIAEPGIDQGLACLFGAFATAADEKDMHTLFTVGTGHTTEDQLAYLGNEMGVFDPVGFIDPGDVDGTDRVADEEVLHARTDIDQQRPRISLTHVIGVFWTDVL